jgi:uncharacterized membrane protein
MGILAYMAHYIATLLVLIFLDVVWISVIMKQFYTRHYRDLARMEGGSLKPRLVPGLLVWMLIALGLVLFVTGDGAAGQGGIQILCRGALLGLVIYGVYDLTNYSILKDWSFPMTVVDISWGTAVCAVTAWISGIVAGLLW